MGARVLSVLGIVLAVALAPVSASATSDSMMVTTPASLHLTAKVLVTVPVRVTCADLQAPGLVAMQDQISVSIEQAHGRTISHGGASLVGGPMIGPTALLLVCDGTTVNTFDVNVLADTSGSPFKSGPAVVTTSASRLYCTDGCPTGFQSISATDGPKAVRIRG